MSKMYGRRTDVFRRFLYVYISLFFGYVSLDSNPTSFQHQSECSTLPTFISNIYTYSNSKTNRLIYFFRFSFLFFFCCLFFFHKLFIYFFRFIPPSFAYEQKKKCLCCSIRLLLFGFIESIKFIYKSHTIPIFQCLNVCDSVVYWNWSELLWP